jgi:hypothetical protein
LPVTTDDEFVLREQQVTALAGSNIEPDGLSERLSGVEFEQVQQFPGGPVNDTLGDESAAAAKPVLLSSQSLPGDASGVDIESEDRATRDDGSAVSHGEQVLDTPRQPSGPGGVSVFDVQRGEPLCPVTY